MSFRWRGQKHYYHCHDTWNRRKGVASLLMEQVLHQSQLPITVEVQVMFFSQIEMWCVSIVSIQLLNAISNGPFVRLKTEKLLLSTNHWASTWSRQLKTTTGFLPLPCILSFSIIASQEGEQHKRAQAKTCQMTCKKQWYCHSLQSPCSLHLWPYWMEWKENEMILWYKLRIVLRFNMRCCTTALL